MNILNRYNVIQNDFVFSLINSFKERKAEVVEFEHAYRVNGVIDIYKLGNTVYDFELKSHKKFETENELQSYCEVCFLNYKPRTSFKQRDNGKSLQEYNYEKKHGKINTVAEDYAITNAEKVEDDMYFIFVDGRVKIGRSKDYKKRFKQMETAFPSKYFGYIFLGLGGCEKRMHKIFEDYSIKGEWFEDNDRIRRFCQIDHKNVVKIVHNPNKLLIKQYSKDIYLPNSITLNS